jgi:uncharacterized protein
MTELIESEVRVLGTLLEKEATTPEYYPLSLNALINGCNQKSNREPVVSYDAETVEGALEGLRQKGFALFVTGSGRVAKYGQRMSETLNLGRRECAVLCTLFLRGPQTLGEIKDRSERMYSFGDLEEAERVLEKLADRETDPFVRKLARQPGQKEARYAHLFAGEPAYEVRTEAVLAAPAPSKLAQLEQEVQSLKAELGDLRTRFEALEMQLK